MPVAPNTVKNNLNTGIGSVNLLIGDADAPAMGGVQDRLAAHAEASGHGGDFRKNVQGVNDTLDAVTSPLNVATEFMGRTSRRRGTTRR